MHKEFLKNSRRSLFYSRRSKIKTVAVGFGFISFLIIGYVSISIIGNKRLSTGNISSICLQKNAFEKFFYKTGDTSGKEVTIKAEKVIEETKDNFVFEKVMSSFALPNNEAGTITSNFGKATRGKHSVCEFVDNVVMTMRSGMLIRTDRATFDSEKSIISGESEISIAKGETRLSADKYSFDTEKNILTLMKNAKAYSSGRNVTADRLVIEIDNNNRDSIRRLTATGNASLVSADYDLSAKDSLVYEHNKITATRNVDLLYKSNRRNISVKSELMTALLNAHSEISEIFADKNVQIKSKDSVVKADHAVYKSDNKVTALGNVVISKKQGDVFGEEAELDLNTENVIIRKSSGVVANSKGQS